MKKEICITPANGDMEIAVKSLSTKNQFIRMGFQTRKAFCEVVAELNPTYSSYEGVKKLEGFWLMRVKDSELIHDLEVVIDNLKKE